MDQIINAYERINVIRGVSSGVISIGQVQSVAQLYHLDEIQQTALATMLSENGIQPVPDHELRHPVADPPAVPSVPPKTEISPEVRAERLAKALLIYGEDLKEAPDRARQYQEELPLLKQAIVEESTDPMMKRPDVILTRAIMAISRYRVRDTRHKGWVCGTHTNRVKDFFRHKLNFIYSTEELSALVQYCTDLNTEENTRFEQILLLILHDTPQTIVHPRISQYLDN